LLWGEPGLRWVGGVWVFPQAVKLCPFNAGAFFRKLLAGVLRFNAVSELFDFHVAVAGVDGERRASAVQLSVQFMALSAVGLIVVHGERKCAVHVTIATVNIEVCGEVLGYVNRHRSIG